jgi:DNA sulfur modification protein DndE
MKMELKKLQFSRYRFSIRTQNLLGQLKHKTGLGANVLARYAFCLSLKDPSIPNPDEYDEKGMEILPSVMFGEHENIYLALMIDRLNKDGLDPEEYLHRMTRAHLNRGATALFPRIHDLSDFSDIIQQEIK